MHEFNVNFGGPRKMLPTASIGPQTPLWATLQHTKQAWKLVEGYLWVATEAIFEYLHWIGSFEDTMSSVVIKKKTVLIKSQKTGTAEQHNCI